MYPTISEYLEAIKSAEDNFDQLKHLRPVLDDDGQPVMTSGNFAVVFKMKDEKTGRLYAVKCFLREQEGRAEAYRQIAEELEFVSSTFLTPIKYLDKELFVDTNNSDESEFPVLLMDWVEGQTLDKYIREHIGDEYELSLLAYQFSRLAMWLLPQPFAHGDLKPDNILVKDDGTLVLVDYDGMYVPAMKGQKARELGSPDFRHPSRTVDDFDEHIDDFSLVSILLSLKLYSFDKDYYWCYGSDHLLFSEQDYRDINHCEILKEIYPSKDSELNILFSLFIFALEKANLSDVSFNILKLSRPIYPQPETIPEYYAYIKRFGTWTDEFGVEYSTDRKCLLKAPYEIMEYSIPDGTKFIANNAFMNRRELRTISLPNTLVVIGEDAFSYCVKLLSVIIPYSVKKIEDSAFSGCFELTSIQVDKRNKFYDSRNDCNAIIQTHSNTLIAGCSATIIPNNIQKIGKFAFYHCNGLISISIPESVIDIEDYAFANCIYLRQITIPKSVTAIGMCIFENCQNLSCLIVENENKQYDSRNNCNAIIVTQSDTLIIGTHVTRIPNSVIKIGKYSFKNCLSLDTITIPNGITEIEDGAFESCQYLKTIKIPDSVIKIGNAALSDCGKLASIIIPSGKTSKFEKLLPEYKDKLVEQDDSENLKTEVTKEDLAKAWKDEDGVLYSADKTKLLLAPKSIEGDYTIKDGTQIICDRAFYLLRNESQSWNLLGLNGQLSSIFIPNSVTKIGVRAFCGCVGLSSIILPNSLIEIGRSAFRHCCGITSIIIPDKVKKIDLGAFCGCEELETITLPNSIENVGEQILQGCKSLKTIYIPCGTKNKFERLLSEYKDKLVEQEIG